VTKENTLQKFDVSSPISDEERMQIKIKAIASGDRDTLKKLIELENFSNLPQEITNVYIDQ